VLRRKRRRRRRRRERREGGIAKFFYGCKRCALKNATRKRIQKIWLF